MRSPDELTAVYRAEGRRMTAQRQCIFDVLQGDLTHPTAEAVYDAARRRLGTISLKTVYQTLHELAALGEVAEIDVGTGTTRFDPNVESPHHHLVCRRCGIVRDLYVDVGQLELPASRAEGFEVDGVDVVFRGICPACRRDEAPGESPARADGRRGDHRRVRDEQART